MNCEICGAFEEELFKTDVEGAVMNLCRDCSRYGKVVEMPVNVNMQTKKIEDDEKRLKYDYLQIIRKGLQDKGLTIDEVADKIKCSPKDLKRVLAGEIMPDEIMTKRMERFLNLSLYEIDYASDSSFKKSTEQLSFEDVVDIKRTKK
ncbi:MAG: multiprotein-bridging factor 1 family protein [Candidatus Parvarchaeum sp.]